MTTPQQRSLLRPPALRSGDRVAILCVSSPLTERAPLDNGLDVLRFAGLEPVLYSSATAAGTMRPYLAGDDAMRAKDLTAALTDPDIAGIIFSKGGYGAQRTLELIDWDDLRDIKPKVMAGFSDLTALLEAVAVKLGWASLFSPMAAASQATAHYGFGSLLRTLMRPAEATEIAYPQAVTIAPGVASGVTVGGTVHLLASSIGTPTSKPARGGLLLLEEVGEQDYRLDRLLTQLRRSGYLDGVAGIIAGSFDDCGPAEQVEPVLVERLGHLGVPMIAWANIGHGGTFQTFPIGIAAELDATARTLRLLDPPLEPLHPAQQFAVRDTYPAVVGDRPGQPRRRHPLELVAGREPVGKRPPGDRRGHDPVRPHAAPPGPIFRGGETPDRTRRRDVGEASLPGPAQQPPPRVGLAPVVPGHPPVQGEPLVELRRLGIPVERAVVRIPRGDDPARPADPPHLPQRQHRIGDVLQHLMRVHHVERPVAERQRVHVPDRE